MYIVTKVVCGCLKSVSPILSQHHSVMLCLAICAMRVIWSLAHLIRPQVTRRRIKALYCDKSSIRVNHVIIYIMKSSGTS